MKVSAEKVEGSKVVLTVESPATVVDEALDRAYKSVVKRVNVPGFRRGKAPRHILERHFGKGILYEDAMNELLPSQYAEAVKEADVKPVDEPEFDEVNLKQGEPLTFKATVYVQPDVVLGDYSDISVAYEPPAVTEEDIDRQIEYQKERMAELRHLEDDAPLAKGDFAACHVKGIEGGTFKMDTDEDYAYVEVGEEDAPVPGLGDALIGMKKGETKEFTGIYGAEPAEEKDEDSSAPDEAEESAESGASAEGKATSVPQEARFEVEVKETYRKSYPAEEDIVKGLGHETMEALREDLRARIMAMKVDEAKRAHSDKVEDALLEKAAVEIPQVMIERKQRELFDMFVERLSNSGTDSRMFFPKGQESVQEVFDSFAPQAEREVKHDLVLDAIAAKEGVKVNEETLDGIIEAAAREMGKEAQTVKSTLQLRGGMSGIEEGLLRVEALKKIAVEAAVKAGTPLPEDKPAAAKPEQAGEKEQGAAPDEAPAAMTEGDEATGQVKADESAEATGPQEADEAAEAREPGDAAFRR